jgi:hypothetical protein
MSNPSHLCNIKPELDGMVEEWRRGILTKFIHEVKVGVVNRLNTLKNDSPDLYDASDQSIQAQVQLASTVFACIPCQDNQATSTLPETTPLWFPRLLGHRCLTKPQEGGVADGATKHYVLPCHRQRWSCDSIIKVDHEASAAAVAIIEACSMNPSIATADDMDQLDARVECLTCPVDSQARDSSHLVLDWQSAVRVAFYC